MSKRQVSLSGKSQNSDTAKYICITVGAIGGLGMIIWGIGKLVDAIQNGIDNMQEKNRNKEHMDNVKDMRSIQNELWFKDAIANLKSAMEGCKEDYFNSSFVNYDCTKIENVLKELGNKYDWEYLYSMFGKYNGHSLQDWLGCDGPVDRASYNAILEKIDVPEGKRITKQGIWGTDSAILLIK